MRGLWLVVDVVHLTVPVNAEIAQADGPREFALFRSKRGDDISRAFVLSYPRAEE